MVVHIGMLCQVVMYSRQIHSWSNNSHLNSLYRVMGKLIGNNTKYKHSLECKKSVVKII